MSEKKRRIAGKAFWRIRSAMEAIEKAAKELREWREEQAKALEVYPYQLNWGLGVIYSEDCTVTVQDKREVVTNGKIERKIPQEILDEDRKRRDEIETKDVSLGQFRDKLAKKLEVHPADIDLKSGVISDDGFEDIDVDMDDEKPQPKSKKGKGDLD